MADSLHGKQIIGGQAQCSAPDQCFKAFNAATGEALEPSFCEATAADIDRALTLAEEAFEPYRLLPAEKRAAFLEAIADQVEALGDALLERAHAETALPMPRLTGERARATGQARQFAAMIREGSWADARIDRAQPDRAPLPKPDVRSVMVPVGPVVVFGASNFPFAISVIGADTVGALGAGCPVVVKAHPAHPGTCEMVAGAVLAAADQCGLPTGVFSMVHGRGHEVGGALVQHPLTRAVAFTGSLAGGRALYNLACQRPQPIPFYGEMGSANPVFLLPGALAERAAGIAAGYVQSVALGVGQFCTNPALVLGLEGDSLQEFVQEAARLAGDVAPASMLHSGILGSYLEGVRERAESGLLKPLGEALSADDNLARCQLFTGQAKDALANPDLFFEELFGPSSTIVSCTEPEELERMARQLEGSLTATIHGTEEDLERHSGLIRILETKVGRLIFNGFPTGIEVCDAMHHGGPYPATTHAYFTSIGTRGIHRFVRPLCYQGWPDKLLPAELQDANPMGLRRMES